VGIILLVLGGRVGEVLHVDVAEVMKMLVVEASL
jgi:hypothetical protein